MRPQHQQNRRGRGRGNNHGGGGGGNRPHKGQNPLTRSFESNGPDMKVRGTPAHIAEKYLALARDAQSAGDRVLAENYLQHAEHYNRIIMAYREQFQPQGEQPVQRRPDGMEGGDDIPHEENVDGIPEDLGGGPQPVAFASGPAPQAGGEPAPGGAPQRPQHQRYDNRHGGGGQGGHNDRYGDGQPRGDRPFRRDGQPNRFRDRNDRNDRNDRGDRNFRQNGNGHGGEQRGYDQQRFDRGDRGDRGDRHGGSRHEHRNQGQDFRQDRGPRPERNFDRGTDRADGFDRNAQQSETPRAHENEPVGFVAPQPPVAVHAEAPAPVVSAPAPAPAPRRRERLADQPSEQPDFLKRPVRRSRASAPSEAADAKPAAAPRGGDEPQDG